MQLAYFQDAIGLWQEQLSNWIEYKAVPTNDKRFSADEWINIPFFNLLSKQYLLAKEHITSLLEHLYPTRFKSLVLRTENYH